MKLLKKAWAGVKSGFNWIKKHKVVSFLVGGTIIGTGLGMAMGFGLLPSLAGAAAATLGLFAVGGAVFGAGVLVGGLVLLAAMGIGNLLGIGKKKDQEAPPPAVAPADPSPIAEDCPPGTGLQPTPIGDGPSLGETGPLAVNDLDLAPTRQRSQANGATGQRGRLGADQTGPAGLGFASAMDEAPAIQPTPITDAAISPTEITDTPALPMEAPLPEVNMPLGLEPVG
jgi:hypothetical protein